MVMLLSICSSIAISLVVVILASLKYYYFLSRNNFKISLMRSFVIITASQFAGFLFPLRGGSLIIRGLFTIGKNINQLSRIVFVIIAEQLIDFIWYFALFVVLIIGFGKILLKDSVWILLIGISVPVTAWILYKKRHVVLSFVKSKIQKKIEWLNARYPQYAIRYPQNEFVGEMSALTVTVAYMITGAVTLIFPCALYVIMPAFEHSISYGHLFVGFWLSITVGRFSGITLGLGVRDAVLQSFLMHEGIPAVSALKIVLLFRGITLAPVLISGSVSMYIMGRRYVLGLVKTLKARRETGSD